MHRGPRDPACLAGAGGSHHVRFDRCFQAVHPHPALYPPHDVDQTALVDDRWDLFVVGEPALDIVAEPVLGSLADADDRGTDIVEGARELLLVVGEAGLDQHHVHDGLAWFQAG